MFSEDKKINDLQYKLNNHPIYDSIQTLEDLKCFVEHHIYSVWDFMSLVKYLQHFIAPSNFPWYPNSNGNLRRFINEIVLEEETDEIKEHHVTSHFELYLESMKEIGADTSIIDEFINKIKGSNNYRKTIEDFDIDDNLKSFMNFTFDIIESNEAHKIAAAFTFGRENVIPDMFIEIVKGLNKENSSIADKFVFYLERHIELDGDDHGPIALRMIENLCGDDEKKWEDVMKIAKESIEMRISMWTHINNLILN